MKVRLGFVSNSSAASFCIYGVLLNPSKFEKFCKQVAAKYNVEVRSDDEKVVAQVLNDHGIELTTLRITDTTMTTEEDIIGHTFVGVDIEKYNGAQAIEAIKKADKTLAMFGFKGKIHGGCGIL